VLHHGTIHEVLSRHEQLRQTYAWMLPSYLDVFRISYGSSTGTIIRVTRARKETYLSSLYIYITGLSFILLSFVKNTDKRDIIIRYNKFLCYDLKLNRHLNSYVSNV